MREPVRDKGRLEHMLTACDILLERKENDTLESVINDPIKFYGYVKLVEIIGEASYKLTKEYRAAHPEIPWKLMSSMRHVLVHDYYNISPEQMWQTINKDIPSIRPMIYKLLQDVD